MQAMREFSTVVLQAGYASGMGLIFGGNVRQIMRGRESGVDTYLDILASDGDKAYNYAVVNSTLAAGSTAADQAAAASAAFAVHGLTAGHTPAASGPGLPRGRVLYGMARKTMRAASEAQGCSWSIQHGVVQLVPGQGYLPGEAVVLTAATGLVGQPEQTNDGIKVRALLNPRLRVGGRIQLDNRSIKEYRTEIKIGAFNKAPRLDDDGLYRILAIDFSGDTRGGDWYADIICVGIDDSAPIGSKIVQSNGGR